jgi:hypothetical protein
MPERVKLHDEISTCTGDKSIVLGNGFGLSYDVASGGNNFKWTTLLDLCDIDQNTPIYKLLEQCNFDFELAHQKLNNAVDVISKYDPNNTLTSTLQEQVQYLKDQLIKAVASSHPYSFSRQSSEEGDEAERINKMVKTCRNFLSEFDCIFSLNYDLLLYWVRCFGGDSLGRDSFKRIGDKLCFSHDENANFLFPHGALFLYRNGASAVKSDTSMSSPILKRVQSSIENGNFPMCISEGTGKQKLEAIKSNSYLSFAYERIKECEGTIFTFGCSFQDEKDDHIITALLQSRATKIVIGFRYNEAAFYRLHHIFTRLLDDLKTKKEIVLADIEGTLLW